MLDSTLEAKTGKKTKRNADEKNYCNVSGN
uniref:Uncharacterized protein n=1 Tax=Anguilla anguilla TaxID=7936 RepID=A0A0E9RH63_ANGAN